MEKNFFYLLIVVFWTAVLIHEAKSMFGGGDAKPEIAAKCSAAPGGSCLLDFGNQGSNGFATLKH